MKNTISYKLRYDLPNVSLELICIEIESPKGSPFIVIAWYRLPSSSVSSFSNLEEYLRFLDGENKGIILFGDTNCDFSLLTPSVANQVSRLQEVYDLSVLRQLIQEPTRIILQLSSLIDHICTSEYINILESGVRKICLSDLFMIYCVRKFCGGLKANLDISHLDN